MKQLVNILLIVVTALSLFSCSVSKQTVAPQVAPRYDNQTITRLSRQFGLRLTSTDNIHLYNTCSGWLGVKYRYGGNTKNGVDCSGFVGAIYKQVYKTKLERNSANILRRNCLAVNRNSLREGDLLFFNTSGTRNSKVPNHVGLYLKNGKFIHASSSKGVIVSNLSEAYYVRTWITGGRVKR